jgi:Spy/CpxP family protein refolding chaperone
MKKPSSFLLSSAVLAAGLVCSAQVFGQEKEPRFPPDTSAPPPVSGHRDPAQQLEGMTKRYNLSADQQSQIRPLLESQQQQMQALRGDSLLSREDRMAKMQSIRADSNKKIEAILNEPHRPSHDTDADKRSMGNAISNVRMKCPRVARFSFGFQLERVSLSMPATANPL